MEVRAQLELIASLVQDAALLEGIAKAAIVAAPEVHVPGTENGSARQQSPTACLEAIKDAERSFSLAYPAVGGEEPEDSLEKELIGDKGSVALGIVQALLQDHEVLKANLEDYETALPAVLAELQHLKEEAAKLSSAKLHVAELQARLEREANAHDVLVRENARIAARNCQLTAIIHEALDQEGDLEQDAAIYALEVENQMLWQLVHLSQARSALQKAPTDTSHCSMRRPRWRQSLASGSPDSGNRGARLALGEEACEMTEASTAIPQSTVLIPLSESEDGGPTWRERGDQRM